MAVQTHQKGSQIRFEKALII